MTAYDHLAALGYDERDFFPPSILPPRPEPNFWTTPLLNTPIKPWHLVASAAVLAGLLLWSKNPLLDDEWPWRRPLRPDVLILRNGQWIDSKTGKSWSPRKAA